MQAVANLPTELAISPKLFRFKGLTKKQKLWLATWAQCGIFREAARRTGINTSFHWQWKKSSPAYVEALALVEEVQNIVIRDKIYDAGFNGLDTAIVNKGKFRGYYKQPNEKLMMFEAQRRMAEYRANFSVNQFNGPVQLNVKLDSKAVDPLSQTQLVEEENKVD
jgi:hypothetical protein